MPQMKGLKELKLLVSNETGAGGYCGLGALLNVARRPPYPLVYNSAKHY